MPLITFQVLEGIDKGRVFRELPTPITIGREEGNVLRLNDERVSRFHAKVQFDNDEVILTDLESTNGTRVNGNVIQIRRLRPGDRIGVGRSLLLFGSENEIQERLETLSKLNETSSTSNQIPDEGLDPLPTVHANTLAAQFDHDVDADLHLNEAISESQGALFLGKRPLPPLPEKMTPAQAARLAELLDFVHRHLNQATESIEANQDGTQVKLSYGDWQRIMKLQMILARYVRAVGDPDSIED